MRFRGTAYRAHHPRWSFSPLSGQGAAIHGGRFNRRDRPTLYLSLDPITAIKEANQGLARKMQPYVLCSYQADIADIVNLTHPKGRRAAGVEEAVLAADWFNYIAAGAIPPQWPLVEKLVADGCAGAIVPSYAPGAIAEDRNLVLWKWGPKLPYRIAVFDPSGRLPKNQLSWE